MALSTGPRPTTMAARTPLRPWRTCRWGNEAQRSSASLGPGPIGLDEDKHGLAAPEDELLPQRDVAKPPGHG